MIQLTVVSSERSKAASRSAGSTAVFEAIRSRPANRIGVDWFAAAILISTSQTMATEPSTGACDPDASDLGQKVLAVQRALSDPAAPGAIDAVKALGLDSRYYVMVRGWVSMQLAGDRSISNAHGDSVPPHIRDRIDFLERAIRAIDLE